MRKQRVPRLGIIGGSAAVLCLLLLGGAFPATALEPNDLRPGMSRAAVAAVYTGHRSCGSYEFREEPQLLSWEAHLYSRPARVEILFEGDAASLVTIVLFLAPGDDGSGLFLALTEERIRDLGAPLPDSGSQRSGMTQNSPIGGSGEPAARVWKQGNHFIRLERWPVVPQGEIRLTRTYVR